MRGMPSFCGPRSSTRASSLPKRRPSDGGTGVRDVRGTPADHPPRRSSGHPTVTGLAHRSLAFAGAEMDWLRVAPSTAWSRGSRFARWMARHDLFCSFDGPASTRWPRQEPPGLWLAGEGRCPGEPQAIPKPPPPRSPSPHPPPAPHLSPCESQTCPNRNPQAFKWWTKAFKGGAFAQRGHSANYYGAYPRNTPENRAVHNEGKKKKKCSCTQISQKCPRAHHVLAIDDWRLMAVGGS